MYYAAESGRREMTRWRCAEGCAGQPEHSNTVHSSACLSNVARPVLCSNARHHRSKLSSYASKTSACNRRRVCALCPIALEAPVRNRDMHARIQNDQREPRVLFCRGCTTRSAHHFGHACPGGSHQQHIILVLRHFRASLFSLRLQASRTRYQYTRANLSESRGGHDWL